MDTINPATPMDVPSGARERQQVRTGMPLVVYFLGLTIFSLTTSELMVAGMMPSLSAAFGVSIAGAGYLISIYAAGMVVGGPLLTIALLKPGVPNKCALLSLRTSSIVDIPAIDG